MSAAAGQNLVAGKLGRGCGHLPLFLVQVLRGEDLGGRTCLDKKASALGGQNREKQSSWTWGSSPTVWKHYANPTQLGNWWAV